MFMRPAINAFPCDHRPVPAAAHVGMGEEGIVEYSSRGISILHVVDGKVKRHTDYFNYPALSSSFKLVE